MPSETETKKRRVSWRVVWRESRELIWARRRRLALGMGLLLVSRAAGLVLPATTKFLVDEVIGNRRVDLLATIALVAGVATLVQALSSFLLSILLGVAAQRSITDLRRKVQRHMGRLPIAYFESHKSGELISRVMNDPEGVRNLVGTGLVQFFGGLVTAVLATAVLLWLDWRLTVGTLVVMVLFSLLVFRGFGRLRPLFRERGRLMAEVTGRLTESVSGVRVVKAFTAERREARLFAAGAHRILRNISEAIVGVSTVTALSRLFLGLAGLGMSLLGAREVLAGRMTLGDLFMFLVFVGMMVTPLLQMTALGTQMVDAFAGLDRIREVLSEPTETEAGAGGLPTPRLAGDVVFENVGFAYEPDVPVLQDVSFHAPPGTTTALVGPSGAGKSTVISLVLAFRRPDSGRILVDGADLAEMRLEGYRRQLAVVLQEDFLFDGTIAENIAYAKPKASREEIEAAGALASCTEFVAALPDGWDTVIGERGVKLSGGERQRVTIARALLADPRILILDEATSSLDSENEELIQLGIASLKRGRTTFVIAHRLSTIVNADQILVLEAGRVVERGTHAELLARPGRYRSLYEKQFKIERDRFINPGEDFSPSPPQPRERVAMTPDREL